MAERDTLIAWFRSGQRLRSRRVSDIVLTATLDVPDAPAPLRADWTREASVNLLLEPGDVEVMPLARTRWRWPDYPRCEQAASDWTRALGLPSIVDPADATLMACRGARYHHDAEQYGHAAFFNLFLSEDRGLDLHFPFANRRIPLVRGTAVIFDTGQPHGVIRRDSRGFDPAGFASEQDFLQIFLTWELPVDDTDIGRALQLAFDVTPAAMPPPEAEAETRLRLNGAPVAVCPASGGWRAAD